MKEKKKRRGTNIGVKLSDEAGEVVVLEIVRQHDLGKLGRRPNHKPIPLHIPGNYALSTAAAPLFFLFLQQIICLGHKWSWAVHFAAHALPLLVLWIYSLGDEAN